MYVRPTFDGSLREHRFPFGPKVFSMRNPVSLAATSIVSATAALMLAPAAAADSAEYLMELNRLGVRYQDDAMDAMVQIGVAACNDTRAGISLVQTAMRTADRGIGMELGMKVTLTAVEYLCPEFWPQTFRTALDEGFATIS